MSEQVIKQLDEKFCESCGSIIKKAAELCPKCGVRQRPAGVIDGAGKDWLTTLLLCFFLGFFGLHRFYTGSTGIGVVQLLSGGGCLVWAFIDFITILTGSYKDGNGQPLVKK
ncbi:MAG TPA: TM2 domain-containing protein [Spirochaetota bacterium]|nr:TM2 domain-containing protein [Spirochaetota bacterium]